MLTSEEVQHLDPDVDIIVDNDDPDSFFFIMKAGPYKGIAYAYDNVKITPPDEEDPPVDTATHELSFNFFFVENPDNIVPDENFETKIGDLLVKMIHAITDKLPT